MSPAAAHAAPAPRVPTPPARRRRPAAHAAPAPSVRTAPAPRTRPARAPSAPSRRPAAPRARPASRPAAPLRSAAARATGGVLDRLLRGHGWVVCVGVLLVGIVFLNVRVLELNGHIARDAEHAAALRYENGALRLRSAHLGSSERIQRAAAARGLVWPAPGDMRYLRPRPRLDASVAATRLVAPGSATGTRRVAGAEAGATGEAAGAATAGTVSSGAGVSAGDTAATGGEAPAATSTTSPSTPSTITETGTASTAPTDAPATTSPPDAATGAE